MRALRFDPDGRFLILALWCWLTWHWIVRPQPVRVFTWRDVVAIVIGLAWAVWEAHRR